MAVERQKITQTSHIAEGMGLAEVMLDAQGYLKLIDFGIAKKLPDGESKTFTMIGTPHYMAPEVMRGHGYGTEARPSREGVEQCFTYGGLLLFLSQKNAVQSVAKASLVFVSLDLLSVLQGYLPFADDLDDPTEVCTAVNGKTLMKGLLTRQPRKRLGSGLGGWEDVRGAEYFAQGHAGGALFDKLLGRELTPPWVPKGETYCDPEDLDVSLSDDNELGKPDA
eukprot:Skav204676  [mRNA]  locus=scaffold1284:44867:52953:- [translate_table: standard]